MVELFHDWGPWFLMIQATMVAVEAFIPVLPVEIVVIGSGALAADGFLPVSVALLVTFAGCLLGDVGLYAIFRFQLIRVLYRWRWGRTVHRALLRTSVRAGGATTWVGLLLIRWIPGGRTASMATAGIMRLSWAQGLSLGVVGALIWALWLVGLGYISGTTTGLPPWVSTVMGLTIGTLVGLVIAMVAARRRRARSQV